MVETPVFCGLRQDGRRIGELRNIQMEIGIVDSADGSALFQIGNTKVICFVSGPKQARNEKERKVNCHCSYAYFSSTGERKKVTKGDKRSSEFEGAVKQMFEGIVFRESVPVSDIDLNLFILQDDGSVEPAAINACTLALIDAGVPMKDFIVACSSGHVAKQALLDLTYAESSSHNIISEYRLAVLGRSSEIVYINYDDVGGHKLSRQVVQEITQIAIEGCKQIHFLMKQFLVQTFDRGQS